MVVDFSLNSDTFHRNLAAEWHLGNVYLFDCAVRDDEAFLLYHLGPDYVGNLDVKIDQTKVYDHANEEEISASLRFATKFIHIFLTCHFCQELI